MADRVKTHYETLGIPTGADPAEIRRAYVALARRFHPDAHAGRSPAEREHADRRMRDVNEAWSALSDPARRRAYDATLVRHGAGRPDPRPRPAGKPWSPRPDDDAWMDDFRSWQEDTDLLPPDPPGPRRPVRLLPAGILVGAAVVGIFGLVLASRPVLAVAFMLVGISLALWIWLPLVELARSRSADPDR
ncbi:J domain-containing protein [Iamia sp. SCSIO 61187]|uniref:J domain-containing protein n=1 Tax=Iamia sp. SCSIO 61187 TaxID=2722752 RepID=UPI001C626C33|nr:J domain-containing protein [Iamia sp. SCSIO 61187]QYG93347.1 J domain-containing protein [Iamia sp. SCSIO 61187]